MSKHPTVINSSSFVLTLTAKQTARNTAERKHFPVLDAHAPGAATQSPRTLIRGFLFVKRFSPAIEKNGLK
jgi:hypothetical protein